MGDEIQDSALKGESSPTDRKLKAGITEVHILKDPGSVEPLRFIDPDDMNPDEPWILRDPDEKGLILRHRRRRVTEG